MMGTRQSTPTNTRNEPEFEGISFGQNSTSSVQKVKVVVLNSVNAAPQLLNQCSGIPLQEIPTNKITLLPFVGNHSMPSQNNAQLPPDLFSSLLLAHPLCIECGHNHPIDIPTGPGFEEMAMEVDSNEQDLNPFVSQLVASDSVPFYTVLASPTSGLKWSSKTPKSKNNKLGKNSFWGGGGGGGGGGPGGGSGPHPDKVDKSINLASVGGLEEHIKFLKQAVMYPLKHQNSLESWGMNPPKGIMFWGPPGTGKTLLAKAIVNELSIATGANVSFFYQKGGESFSKWFGESEQTLRNLFKAAIRHKPSIIFLDEIDGLCPDRERSADTSQAYASVVTALLGLIDSVKRGEVFIIGATNRLESVDPAIRRPGRFDKDLQFPLPNEDARKKIISIHTSKWLNSKPTPDSLNALTQHTVGFTGADLEKLCKDTLVCAMGRSGDIPTSRYMVTHEDWDNAFRNMRRSMTNVFGSTLFVSDPITKYLYPLMTHQTRDIIMKLKPVLEFCGGCDTSKNMNIRSLNRNAFLIWEPDVNSGQFLHSSLMRAVLSDVELNKIPTYILDVDTINQRLGKPGTTVVDAVGQIIRQVTTSSGNKPCILYVPGINHLHQSIKQLTKEKENSVIVVQLKQIWNSTKNSSALLLATCTGPMQHLSVEFKIRDLFQRDCTHQVKTPNVDERKQFFEQLFGNRENYKAILARIVEVTDGDQADLLLKLFHAVSFYADKLDRQGTRERVMEIVLHYQRNNLDDL